MLQLLYRLIMSLKCSVLLILIHHTLEKVHEFNDLKPNVVFQHEEAPPHIHNKVTTFLNRQLPEQWFDHRGIHVLAYVISRSNAPRLSPLGVL
jgi:hypothetical protein